MIELVLLLHVFINYFTVKDRILRSFVCVISVKDILVKISVVIDGKV